MSRDNRRTFGNTRQESSGRWSARYPFEGRRVSVKGTFATKKAAEAELAKIQTGLGLGMHVDPSRAEGTLGEWWDEYRMTKHNWRARTRRNRETVWRLHVGPTFDARPLNKLSKTQVRSWYAALYAKHPATANSAYRLLRQVILAAIEDDRMPAAKNPCKIDGAGIDRSPERQIATVAEVEAIVAAIAERFWLFVLLAMYAGLRRSEILGLRRRDFDLVHLTVKVARTVDHGEKGADGGPLVEDPKTAAGKREIHFPASIQDNVAHHLDRFVGPAPDAWVFTGERSAAPLRPHVFAKAFRRARLAAGRPTLTLHDLRHTADTLAAATGATLPELMYRMGHKTPHSALRYLHATKDRDRVISEALSELRPVVPVIDLDSRRSSR
jgi:integrase